MKIFTLLTVSGLSLCAIHALNAQESKSPWSFGVKAGINLPDVSADINFNKVGFNAGVMVDYDLGKRFFLSSGMEFTTKGGKFHQNYINQMLQSSEEGVELALLGQSNGKLNLMYLQLPLTVGYKLPVSKDFNITFKVGGYLAYGVEARFKEELKGTYIKDGEHYPYNFKMKYNGYSNAGLERWDWGLLGGVGFEYKKFSVNLSYEIGLRNLNNDFYYHSYTGGEGNGYSGCANKPKWKNRNATLSVGYKF